MDVRDPEAFRVLYKAHYRTVCRYLAARTERDLVEDIAAETFLIAWRKQADMPDHVMPWLLNTASKCLSNQRRSKARANALVERLGHLLRPAAGMTGMTAASLAIDERVAQREQLHALVSALASLGERDLELLLLSHWDGLAPREIAAVLELSPVLLRARLHRASRRLQQALSSELGRDRDRPHLHPDSKHSHLDAKHSHLDAKHSHSDAGHLAETLDLSTPERT